MREIAVRLTELCAAEARFALATVVSATGSTPRPVGTVMAVTADGEVVGSLSGGCVEGAVHDAALRVLTEGGTALESYGISDDDAFAVGLTCGGSLDVLVAEPDYPVLAELLRRLCSNDPVALATVVRGSGAQLLVAADDTAGTLGTEGLDWAVTADARGMLAAGQDGVRHYGSDGERRVDDVPVLVQSFTPPPGMLVYGATDFARALADVGAFLGYRVTVCDARPVFATPRRFPSAAEVVCRWPHEHLRAEVDAGRVDGRAVVAVLTHDPRFDGPLLQVALASPAGDVGAMGSRRTHESRLASLRAAGVDQVSLARLRSPIGLDIGGRTAEETAVSIAAELVQVRWGGTGQPLSQGEGTIHWSVPDSVPVVR